MSSTVERRRRDADQPLLSVEGLKTHFPVSTGLVGSLRFDRNSGGFPVRLDDSSVKAVDGVDFDLYPGETLGVVGESGCGKSTLARTVVGLEEPTDGTIRFDGRDVTNFESEDEQWFRENVQMVFQDPMSSLNPRRKVGEIIADPLEAAGWSRGERKDRAVELLEQVGLDGDYYGRYPHEFSGGQRQRINLARALSINPDLVIADEPVSGLDMSVQAQILSLMNDLQEEFGLTYLFITHDLGVIRNMADRVSVMYVGDFVETGPTERLFTEPHHPYTRSLLDAVPNPNPDTAGVVAELTGDVPSPTNPPSGCKFHTRCPAFVVPEGFTDESYAEFAAFRDDVESGAIDADRSPDEVVAARFDRTNEIPADAERAVREAAEEAARGNRDDALGALAPHESVCESKVPPLESVGENHRSACHLDAEASEAFEW
ncbi:ABC transporter ATP-binding protein [Halorussus salinus]|uniref:ABC transporter ATP-binding protein n=1 Tax=Halorussus salinus TaxID=1364935 RepID=UPI001092E855|nr:oligopeptide/dipeptide ABC transporter ATP-binding protein [Halorussus salinus]